ncbi:MAG: hypothetical protein GX221_08540 [Candidatus Riflebacteria bacterium]|nr:hypothetical protein [Candidatus Riflebacteria bacterium]
MRKISFRTMLTVLAMTLLCTGVFADEIFVPRWKKGDSWAVDTTTLDVRNEKPAWQPAERWVFKVRNITQFQGQDCYVLHVHSSRRSNLNQAVLWLSVKDLRPLKIIDVFPSAGSVSHSERDLSQGEYVPLLAKDTPVPYDLPVFPLTTLEEDTEATRSVSDSAIHRDFSSVRQTGRLSFKRKVTQTEKAPGKTLRAAFPSKTRSGETALLYQVTIGEERSKIKIEQVWQEDKPWALTSESATKKSKLVIEEKKNSNGGEE